ncbi:MAG: hypothetical protein WC662_03915 [Candidatus Paceibacterota bacterium]|jgi:hypothetical protein
MKISGSFLMMLLIWVLGFTHLFGGPYLFFKVIFWIGMLPFLITIFLFLLVGLKTRKFFQKTRNINNDQSTIHVDAEIKEEK